MHKYGYVDQAVDARYHRPTLKREVTDVFCFVFELCIFTVHNKQNDEI